MFALHPFLAWPSVRQFHNVRSNLLRRQQTLAHWRGKIKLHGANAGVRISSLGVSGQSRHDVLTEDLFGFRSWIETHSAALQLLAKDSDAPLTLFGEWCGPDVQRKVALTQLAHPILAVFAIERDGCLIIDPQDIQALLGPLGIDTLFVLPWQTPVMTVDLLGSEASTAVIDQMNAWVDAVEAEDPWVKETFGLCGRGEGLVFFPCDPTGHALTLSLDTVVFHVFKAKGASHRVVKQASAVLTIPVQAKGAEDFVALVTPIARLEQGAQAVAVRDRAHTSAFIQWMMRDVHQECQAELSAAGLEWEQIIKPLTARVRTWWLDQACS